MRAMTRSLRMALLAAAAAAGCSGGSNSPPPDMAPSAPPVFTGTDNTTMNPADYSCLGTRTDPGAPTSDTPVTGVIKDFQYGDLVVGAVVKVYATPTDVPASPLATSAPSDMMGNWSVTVPAGHYRVIFGTSGGMGVDKNGTMSATIPTYEFNRVYNDNSRVAVEARTRDVIEGLVSVPADPSLGAIAGSVRDCGNMAVGGAQIAVSGTSSSYDAASLTFYFVDANGTMLPARGRGWTTYLGLYVALNVPVGTATVTAQGVVASGAPKTLGKETIPVLAGAITIADVLPLGP
jgi:hypothetical protein